MVFINPDTPKFNTSNAHNTNPLSQPANNNQDDTKKNKSDLVPWIVGGAAAVGAVVAITYLTKGKGAKKAAEKAANNSMSHSSKGTPAPKPSSQIPSAPKPSSQTPSAPKPSSPIPPAPKPPSQTPSSPIPSSQTPSVPKPPSPKPFAPQGGIKLEDLVAVHMTDRLPENLVIKSTRAATTTAGGVGKYRDTVHFALNHAVGSHTAGNWDYCKYAILAPLKEMAEANKEGCFQGSPLDFYHKGSVKLPKGTIIVRCAKHMPQDSKYEILEPDKIRHIEIKEKNYTSYEELARAEDANLTEEEATELKKLADQGVKIINAPNPHAAVEAIIKRSVIEGGMNRPSLPSGEIFTWGDSYGSTTPESVANLNAWKNFAAAQGWDFNAHTYSPLGNIENVLGFIQDLSDNNNKWTHSKNTKIDYRARLVDVLEKLKNNKKVAVEVKKLTTIINDSESPKEAIEAIQESIQIKPMAPLNVNNLYLDLDRPCTSEDSYAIKFHQIYGEKFTVGDSAGDLFRKKTISLEDFVNFKERVGVYLKNLHNGTKNPACTALGINIIPPEIWG